MPIGNIPGLPSTNEEEEETSIRAYEYHAYNFSHKTT